jgi:alkyl hydroperoxide reductase subunit AhpC
VRGFRAHYDKFQAVNTEIIEISCDSVAVQKAWVESMGDHEGVESDGIIYWSNIYTDSIPAAGELLHEIEKL